VKKKNSESKTAPLSSKGAAPTLGAYGVGRPTNGMNSRFLTRLEKAAGFGMTRVDSFWRLVELVAGIGGKEKFRVKDRTLEFEGCGTPSWCLRCWPPGKWNKQQIV
jgi:hypothetical protein